MMTLTQSQFKTKWNLMCEGVANDLRNEIIDKVPVDTGRLKSSIKVKKSGKGFEITAVDYMYYIEFGSLPHIIRPKDKQALFWKGAEHPVKEVRHPGCRPNPVIRNLINTRLKPIVIENIKRQFT
jgi:hypothetical protein